MNNNLIELEKKMGSKWPIFEKLHKTILSANPNIEYHVFPIYIGYYLGDKSVAIVYFRGKFVSDDELDVGLGLEKKPKVSGFVDAKYMHYNGVNYSIKLKTTKKITKEFIAIVKSIGKRDKK
ncbi:MAG TPA: hypothetical protein VMV71_04160 [Candidatus Paceibacterota bacterium]|nr:hypothetical protein [Candidatus Paceibacterota bacterium]